MARTGFKLQGFTREALASIVVFLIALPLCMGIAIASGVPPALGLITGIIGGLVVGTIAGSPLQVSGPAAGVAVIIFELIHREGLEALGPVVILAGLIQIVAGLLKLGRWFRAVSPAVLHGMLSGIGVLIVVSQLQVMVDLTPKSSGLGNVLAVPQALIAAFSWGDEGAHHWAAAIGIFTLAVLWGWKHLSLEKKTFIPAALPAVVLSALAAFFLHLPIQFIAVPHNLLQGLNLPTMAGWANVIDTSGLLAAFCLAFIASAETLLSAVAVDQMHNGQRAQFDKELIAQGVGNTLCGMLGALPMTGVIARSQVNIEAGAKTRWSAVLHGLWLLLVVLFLPWLLEYVPKASLAALLVFTGFKLIDLSVIKKLMEYGRSEVMIMAATISMILVTDLLTGVLVGLVCSLVKLVWSIAQLDVQLVPQGSTAMRLTMKGWATFLSLPTIAEQLERIPQGAQVEIDIDELDYADHACVELLENFSLRHQSNGGTVALDWKKLKQYQHRLESSSA